MATSTAQTIPLVEVYDYVLAPGDPSSATTAKGKSGKQVKVTLQYDRGLTIAPDAVVWTAQEPVVAAAVTDANGFWHVFLVPNNKISPANTYYTVEIDGGISYQIQVTDQGVPGPGWQSSAPGILLNIPSALAPTTSTVGAITATGLITAQAGINVTAGGVTIGAGGESIVGGLTVDTITYSQAVSRLIPGGTSFSVRDTANANDNLLVTNAGNVTARGSLTVTGGPLTVSAGGISVTGNSTVTGTLTVTSTLTVSANGAAITGNSTVTGTLTVSGLVTAQAALTVSSGNLTITAGTLNMSAAASRLVPGATSFSIRDNANANDNLIVTNAGVATIRGGLSVTAGNVTVVGGHLLATGGSPSLGALQTNVSAQSLTAGASDNQGQVSITTGNPAPGAGAPVAIVNFGTGYAATPRVVVVNSTGASAVTFCTSGVGTGAFTIRVGPGGLSITTTYTIDYIVLGSS